MTFSDLVPRQLGAQAAAGELTAGLLPLVDYFRLGQTFERLGRFGIAVRGRAYSALLFSRKPIRLLERAAIAMTQESSTSVCLLRLILEERYHLKPIFYSRGYNPQADALLLIGDEALRFQQTSTAYPYETDLAFEWWLWQHLPFVFAVWGIRKDAGPSEKQHLERTLARTLALNTSQLESIAKEQAVAFQRPVEELHRYLSTFIYRLSQPEEEAIERFRFLLEETGIGRGNE